MVMNYIWILAWLGKMMTFAASGQLVVNLTSRNENVEGPLKWLSYCVNCPSPASEGSVLRAINAKYGLWEYKVTGKVIYCVPNHAESPRLMNHHQMQDRIVLVDRGIVSMYEKVERIQASEALGVIIADDGTCEEGFRYCKTRTGTVEDGGFAAFDDEQRWLDIEIPVVLVTQDSADRLRKLMGIERVYIKGYGYQNVTSDDGYDGHPDPEDL